MNKKIKEMQMKQIMHDNETIKRMLYMKSNSYQPNVETLAYVLGIQMSEYRYQSLSNEVWDKLLEAFKKNFEYTPDENDTWEKWRSDAKMNACDYLNGVGYYIPCGACVYNDKDGIGCNDRKVIDLERRAKELCGVENETNN